MPRFLHAPSIVAFALAASLALPAGGSGQSVLARVVDDRTSQPVFGALAYLLDGDDGVVRNALTDELGRAMFVGVAPGSYRIKVEMIGMATAISEPFELEGDAAHRSEIRLEQTAIQLEGIEVKADERCRIRPEDGQLLSRVWDEARKALEAARYTDDQDVYRYRTVTYERDLDRDSKAVVAERENTREAFSRVPFVSRPAEDLVENGFSQFVDGQRFYYAPDAEVLLSDPFLDAHCFRLREGDDETESLIGLEFEPAGGRSRRVVDIAGTLWLDPATSELKWLDFRYRNLDPDMTTNDVGGRVEFRRLPRGTWIVPEWWIRMPVMGQQAGLRGRRNVYVKAYQQAGGRVLDVRETGGATVVRAESGTLEGIVVDSLGALPLPGVRVGVVGARQEVYTNEEGRFRIGGLIQGVYRVRFVDERLEDFGFVPDPVEREVKKGEVTSVIFRMPALGDLLFEACRGKSGVEGEEGSGVVAGRLRDAVTRRGLPADTVRIQWDRYRMTPAHTSEPRRITGADVFTLQATTDDSGFYRICGVPEGQLLRISAVHDGVEFGADTLRIPDLGGGRLFPLEWRSPR